MENKPCIRCGKVPADGWYSKSGYCKDCAEAILQENAKKEKRPWYKTTGGIIILCLLGVSLFACVAGLMDPSMEEVQEATAAPQIDKEVEGAQEAEAVEQSTGDPQAESVSNDMTMGQKNALSQAESYLRVMPFSRDGLVEQLEYEGYSHDDAVFAVSNCGADWSEQALLKAISYLDIMAFSQEGLVDQLLHEGFSEEQARYGVKNCGADWDEQAALKAQSYLEFMSFSRDGLIDQLEYEGFTREQAEYGVSAVGY